MMIDRDQTHEDEPVPFDISERIKYIIENQDAQVALGEIMKLQEELRGKMSVSLTLDFSLKILTHAQLIRKILEIKPLDGKWVFTVRATKSQMKDVYKVFGGDVVWEFIEG